ncbi:MAG TPA: FAD-binding oxidoreductase [Dehalococcoidia bacterium]|nr:FAD-binding oxidoreductase [Dehalococcoidia bacterium]
MGINGKELQFDLQKMFDTRVSFRKLERKLYGHDIAAIPGLVKPFIGNTVPDAVVQPQTEAELIELVRWASSRRVALTPRGGASSGYGGVIPVKRGVVVDFYRMRAIKEIDTTQNTVTVESGIVWEELDRELMKQGLTLRLYPSSYPSATVGGWLAQGGAGIGSFEAGWFRDNVLSARVVMPDGSVRVFSDDDLDLISSAEGITGLISEVTLLVQSLEDLDVVAIGCPDIYGLQKMAENIIEQKLPIWSLIFINPRMAELKNRAPLLERFEYPVEERVLLPASYIMTLTFRRRYRKAVMDRLDEVMKPCQAELLSQRIAEHEWENRFKIMLVKRLGPSLVPAEVVIPLARLGDVMIEIENKIDQPVVKEGIVIREGACGEPEVVILGFIPSDQRHLSYNFIFGLALTAMKIAEKYGGYPYSTGIYFTGKAKKIMGKDILLRLKDFKRRIDPKGILNPGKVVNGGAVGSLVSIAGVFEPIIRFLGNRLITRVGERTTKPVRSIPADIVWYAYGCSQCGYCVRECDQFYGRGWESQSPRGKWYWLREYMEGREEWDQFMVDTILVCTTCELCNLRCSASLPIESSWMKLRGQLINEEKKMTFPPFEMMAASLTKEGDIWAAYRENRSDWFPEELWEKHGPSHKAKVAYFAGCTASHVETDIAIAAVRLLDAAGVDFTYAGNKENCCGTPMLVAGKWDIFVETMKKNIAAIREVGADTVVTSCPACDMMWRQIYPRWAERLGIDYGITGKHYSEVIAEQIKNSQFSFPETGKEITVTLHDSCHIGRVSSVYDAPRDMVTAIPGVELVEMEHNREWAHCCGSVLTLIKEPHVAAEIGKARLDEATATGAEKVLALCPCCQFQFRVTAKKKGSSIEIVDLARFAAETLGYELPNSNPEVQRQWAVFEAMIALMTPEGFAALMGTMWPELIDAMPFGMGKMMRVMGKIPGALNLMKPLFPVLFPRLLPMMMPKVMPVMLERVAERIPMPQYMREQMPELMPKVMDNLIPHMIGDVVPLVTGSMISYLRGK